MWWMTGVLISWLLMTSNTRREAWMRLTPSAMLSSTTTGFRVLRAEISSVVSVPSTSMARRVEPSGSFTPPALCALTASLRVCRVTAPGRGSAASTAAGTMVCTVTSCSLLRARRPSASEEGGIWRMMTESLVAMSLKGMPTTSLAPSFLYRNSGCLSSSTLTTEKTVPSRCSRPRKSYCSPSTCLGRSPTRRLKVWVSRVFSSKAGTPRPVLQAVWPRLASLLQGSISYSGSSVRDTRMVSPSPSISRAPIPMADFMRPSSPSPASVTPKCRG
mmetsp:Transcript_28469/g.62660  ORF Transcript_28469/g.62660 Transcript_28469/m.62660 type:complete len:274 (-) Transcript_28469:941-1762(-)